MTAADEPPAQGYYRFPTLFGDRVVFVAEDDLWEVTLGGGSVARRLTTAQGAMTCPVLSPDGSRLAFVGEDEGVTEVYVMAGRGGRPTRLTFDGHHARIVGWTPDGKRIVFSSTLRQPFARVRNLYTIDADGGEAQPLPLGPAHFVSFGPGGRRVLCRNQDDIALWKRYRGGTAGALWVESEACDGTFERILAELPTNLARPHWIGERLYFVSDHTGRGELCSCLPDGSDMRVETSHGGFYVRHPTTDGTRIVYSCGADLWLFEPALGESRKIEFEFASASAQRARRFVDASEYLEEAVLHPRGHSVLFTSRGQVFSMGLWEGAVRQPTGSSSAHRHRLARYLDEDGEDLLLVSDAGGEEALEIHAADGSEPVDRLEGLDLGRALELKVDPDGARVLLTNHRHELVLVDLEAASSQVLVRSDHDRISGFAWSPDGRYVAYSLPTSHHTASIHLRDLDTGEDTAVTAGEFRDVDPVFDDKGRYLYFISYRDFDPVYDSHSFALGFPRGMRLCLVTLSAELRSPFVPTPRPLDGGKDDEDDEDGRSDKGDKPDATRPAAEGDPAAPGADSSKPRRPPVRIDLEGIERRVVLFPVGAANFGHVEGAGDRVFFTVMPVSGSLGADDDDDDEPAGTLKVFDLEELELSTVMGEVHDFSIGADRKTLLVLSNGELRAIPVSHQADKDGGDGDDEPGRKSGWLDLSRGSVEVVPGEEWRQMLRESWRLMRDHFWTADMGGIDWAAVYERYAPLVERVGSRSEFSDLVWEMQGELGTSHAYEYGGDYRIPPGYDPGFLGADFVWDEEAQGYRIERVVAGDTWDRSASSPLEAPGLGIGVGDVIVAIDGRPVGRNRSVQSLLVNRAGREVDLTFVPAPGKAVPAAKQDELARKTGEGEKPPRQTVTVKTLRSEFKARYREWVASNRRYVHEASGGQVGYVHVPDMGPEGFSEFHRSYMAEANRVGLVIDVRFNGGGHVSQLLLEKLARRRLGYDVQRWGRPMAYPAESVLGPIVALTNEHAGSDGDIFSHCFRLMKLGPLVGKRTWGGVIGIWPRHTLVDGSVTSQPEFAFWFVDVGWKLENHGAEPDIEVELAPHDYAAGRDPQLERALAVCLERIATEKPALPDFGARPSLRAE